MARLLVPIGKEKMQMSRKAFVTCAGLLVVFATVFGCGKRTPTIEANRGSVTGIVSLDGKPLRGGNISFISVTDPAVRKTCTIGPDGSFSVPNAPLGDVLVSVETESEKIGNPNGYVPIPKKYTNVKTSKLKATITKDDPNGQKLTFDLKSK
jgi:hypothetical protein